MNGRRQHGRGRGQEVGVYPREKERWCPMSELPIRRSRTPSADVERELLAAAEAVLVREGPAGLTVRAVAAEAGIGPLGGCSRPGGQGSPARALPVRRFGRPPAPLGGGDTRRGPPAPP